MEIERSTWSFAGGLSVNRNFRPIILLAAAGLPLLFGCAIQVQRVDSNTIIRPAQADFIVPGRTTMPEVVNRLGAPQKIIGSDDRTVFRYEFFVTKDLYINYGQLIGFIPGLAGFPNFSLESQGSGANVFQVGFDRRWVAQDYAFLRGAEDARFSFWPF